MRSALPFLFSEGMICWPPEPPSHPQFLSLDWQEMSPSQASILMRTRAYCPHHPEATLTSPVCPCSVSSAKCKPLSPQVKSHQQANGSEAPGQRYGRRLCLRKCCWDSHKQVLLHLLYSTANVPHRTCISI